MEPVCSVSVLDSKGETVAIQKSCMSTIYIEDAHFWWPYGMHSIPGYLYQMYVSEFIFFFVICFAVFLTENISYKQFI